MKLLDVFFRGRATDPFYGQAPFDKIHGISKFVVYSGYLDPTNTETNLELVKSPYSASFILIWGFQFHNSCFITHKLYAVFSIISII